MKGMDDPYVHILVRHSTKERLKDIKNRTTFTWDEFLLRLADPNIEEVTDDDKQKMLDQLNEKELQIRILLEKIARLEETIECMEYQYPDDPRG